jgi:hypothetical protein
MNVKVGNMNPFKDYEYFTVAFSYKCHIELMSIDNDGFTYKIDVLRRDDLQNMEEIEMCNGPLPFKHLKSYMVKTDEPIRYDAFKKICKDIKEGVID